MENKFLKLFKPKKPLFARNKKEAKEIINSDKPRADEFVKELIKLVRDETNKNQSQVPSLEYTGNNNAIFIYDFIQEYGNGNGFSIGGMGFSSGGDGFSMDSDSISDSNTAIVPPTPTDTIIGITGNQGQNQTLALDEGLEKAVPKKKLKPIDVWKEMETIPVNIDIKDIDDKIMVLNMKKEFIRYNNFAKKEVIDMILRLENRKKYEEHKGFFEQYDNTTTEKIQALIDKYDLVLKTTDLFIPKFPKDAMIIMTNYDKKVQEICGRKPVFYVIAEKSMFKAEEKRNDPILLVQSPFGIYWQILGAWGDKDIVLMEDL